MAVVAGVLLLLAAYTPLQAGNDDPGAPPHDFHVSITQIDYSEKEQSLQITVKIFTDDLELALETLGAPRLHLGTELESDKTRGYLERYLENRLKIAVNDAEQTFTYLGKEVEYDATWCYLEVPNVPLPTSIKVKNRILLEIFDDQSNLVHLSVAGKKQSLMLRKGHVTEDTHW